MVSVLRPSNTVGVRSSWLRIAGGVAVALVAGGVAAGGEQHSERAREFFRRLGERNLERDYRELEVWAFEQGLPAAERRKRCEEAAWVLTDDDYNLPFRTEKEVWADDFLDRLHREEGDELWAWLLTGEVYSDLTGQLVMERGKFRRAGYRESPTHYCLERDYVLAMQAFRKALHLAEAAARDGSASHDDLAEACLAFGGTLAGRSGADVLRLTDLDQLPEITTESPWSRRGWDFDAVLVDVRSPVIGPDGGWRLPRLRESFDEAATDCERACWLLHRAAEISPKHRPAATIALAEMWHGLLGVENLVEAGYVYLEGTESEFDPEAPGEFEMHTLKDHETILIGAHGPERRVIPEGYRYLAMLRGVVADDAASPDDYESAVSMLLSFLADRCQYDAAETLAREVLAKDSAPKYARETAQDYLNEIAPDARFFDGRRFVAGAEASVGFVSRGIARQHFELWRLKPGKLERGRLPDWGKLDDLLSGTSEQSFEQGEGDPFLSHFKRVTAWDEPIRIKGNHMQTVSRIRVPVHEPGNYLLVAKLAKRRLVLPVQVCATLVMSVPIEGTDGWGRSSGLGNFFVIDARTGRPVTGAEVSDLDGARRSVSDHTGFLPVLEGRGTFIVRRPGLPAELVELGIESYHALDGSDLQSFFVTDQPLYQPGRTVQFAGWLKRPNWHGHPPPGLPAGSEALVKVTDPVGQVIYQQELPLDEFGGFQGSFGLDTGIVLGSCGVEIEVFDFDTRTPEDPFAPETVFRKNWERVAGRWSIEVGEFRKPDFRVEVESEAGGGGFAAVVRANYHSGEPVQGAQVTARLRAFPYQASAFPERKWDELYWEGYDWPLARPVWMNDWQRWAIHPENPEDDEDYDGFAEANVAELHAVGVTDGQGRARLEFKGGPTLLEGFDHRCEVRVGVQEFTGRSVGAEDEFCFSGREFEVFARPLKGFFRDGEALRVELITLDQNRRPVSGRGVFRIESITRDGDALKPAEVWRQTVQLDNAGRLELAAPPLPPGQYRCLFAGGGGERGFVIEVLGRSANRRVFDGLQLTPERAVCAPGEEVEVLLQSEQNEALVWLFEVMPDGLRRTPRLIETKDQAALVKIPVLACGMPEFYLLAATVVDGRLKSARCRIVVPPVESRLEVTMKAQPERGAPGGEAAVAIEVRGPAGRPADASLAVTAFDRALEDLGKQLPRTSRLRDRFEFWERPCSSIEPPLWRDGPIVRLSQPGCLFSRGDLTGDPRWQPTSRFERVGPHLWDAYDPPELPNSVGSSDPFAAFPMTPATPASPGPYDRSWARDAELDAAQQAGMATVGLRKNFADRAYWGAPVRVDAAGRAEVRFKLPDNLTAWRVQSWAFGRGQAFGDGQVDIEVSKPLQIRPLLPRAAVVGDELRVGLLVQNLTGKAHEFLLTMEADGAVVAGAGRSVTLAAGAEGRAEWPVTLQQAGTARFRFRARSRDGSLEDGAESPLPVAPRSVPVQVAATATIDRHGNVARLGFDLDEELAGATVRVRVEAHPAVSALAVLPDLVDYPHGCTEQTLNRFLPLLVAWQAAESLGLDWQALERHLARDDRSLGWVRGRAGSEPQKVAAGLDEKKVRGMIHAGLDRLDDLQGDSGAWGWFSPGDPCGATYLTALAVRGIERAKQCAFELKGPAKGRRDPAGEGARWLAERAAARAKAIAKDPGQAEPLDAFVAQVLAARPDGGAAELKKALCGAADHLPAAGLIHLALALDGVKEADELRRLTGLARSSLDAMTPDGRHGWRWWEDPVETRAWFLMLLVKGGAGEQELRAQIEHLLALRHDGVRWKSTRDSALCVEAIIAAAARCGKFGLTGNQAIDAVVECVGQPHPLRLDSRNLWSGFVAIPLDKAVCATGRLEVLVRRGGELPLSVSASVSHLSEKLERMGAAAEGIEVVRNYHRVGPDGARKLVGDGEPLRVGELVEVELVARAPAGLEFVHLTDPIPAGLEPLVQSSGYDSGCYRESRNGETHLFFSELDAWNGIQRYTLRAVTPGRGMALPARAECMYSPAVSGQSERRTIVVE